MKLKYYFTLSIASFVMVSCTSNSTPQLDERSVVQSSPSAIAQSARPDSSSATSETILKSGTFVAGEHPTAGTVRLISRNGSTVLQLNSDFSTSEQGPDLVVILHRSDDVIGSTESPAHAINEGDYVVLAPLQQFSGAQSYVIPDTVNLADYQSAGIWCRTFNALFGAAALQ
jgi:Electron transfer DM13